MAGPQRIGRNRGWILLGAGSLGGSLLAAALVAIFSAPAQAATTVITVSGTGDTSTPSSCAPSFPAPRCATRSPRRTP
jgi:hypothetical protein